MRALLRKINLRLLVPLMLAGFALVAVVNTIFFELPSLSVQFQKEAERSVMLTLNRLEGTLNRLFRIDDMNGVRQEVSFLGSRKGTELALLIDEKHRVVAASRYALLRDFPKETLTSATWALVDQALEQMRGVSRTDRSARKITGVFPIRMGGEEQLHGKRFGFLILVHNYASGYEQVERLVYRHLTIMILLLAFVALLLWAFFKRAVTGPVEELVKASGRLAVGDYEARAEIAGSEELAKLGLAFNTMAGAIREYHASLEQSEARLRSLMQNIATGVVVHGPDTAIVEANPAASEILGLSPEQLLGKEAINPAWHFLRESGEVLPLDEYPVMMVLEKKSSIESYVVGIRQPGREQPAWVLVNGVPEFGEEGILERILISFIDVTDRKAAETALRENEHYLRSLLDSQPNIVVINDGEHLVDTNLAFFHLFTEYDTVEAFRKEHRCICEFFEPSDHDHFLQADMAGRSWIEVLLEDPATLYKVMIRRGMREYVFAVRLEVATANEQVRNIVTFSDITELEANQHLLERRVEAELAKQRTQEEQLLQQSKIVQMGEMITNISHHWRQPLNFIAITIQDLLDAYDFGELDREYLEEAVKEAMKTLTQMSETIDRFREFMVTKGEKRCFDPAETVRKSLGIIQPSMEAGFINVESAIEEGASVYGDMNLLGQSLYNLLANAHEALEECHSKKGRVRVTLEKETDGTVRIAVQDNAGGIDEAVMGRIFEPFFTTHEKATKTGTGLYFAKIFVERELGGKLRVENRDEGACFTIVLPPAPADAGNQVEGE